MSINSAMYTAVTGLSALSTGMQTISNNIANVNTVGFKAMRTNYEDLISQNYFSGGKANQRGCGVKVSTIQSMFTQGAFMASAQDTDMAIAGEGFFQVRNPVDGGTYYTRAGVFTLTKEGLMEDPSGNILQGWQMSIPKPGKDPVKIGSVTDVKITVMNSPPLATSTLKIVNNLDARDENVYPYSDHEMTRQYADGKAVEAATVAKELAIANTYTSADGVANYSPQPIPPGLPPSAGGSVGSGSTAYLTGNSTYQQAFVDEYNRAYGTSLTTADTFYVVSGVSQADIDANRANGIMSYSDFESVKLVAVSEATAVATAAGKKAYDDTYRQVYESTRNVIEASLTDWQLEGNGFAGAWNAQEEPYIDQENYTHVEPISIYDSLGNKHDLKIYYQKNPHMEQVWDYIITCDPLEDARKDSNNKLLLNDTASFSGLIQKGKITFSADGVIKDIEAQNIDLSATKMATLDEPQYNTGTSVTVKNATIGGYFNGSPTINPFTGQYESSAREYTLIWGREYPEGSGIWTGNVDFDPPTSGFTCIDNSTGKAEFVPVYDKQTAGPYSFGSGLTITFDKLDTIGGLKFGTPGQDTLSITAHSEQTAWTNLAPNKEGYFDFDVAFVQSASMALHPPYPEGMPTIIQNIALDMGAKNPSGLSAQWILDESSTTQYADKSATFFNGQDGYAAGSLQRVSIGEDGVVTGVYSNGRHQALYQIGLVRFMNPWGLSKEGDNLFAETRYSGAGALNQPGYGGTGTILANYLEQSTVDIAEEIVSMIVTQRGFQANSKTVTTTDTMLAEIIEMKR